VQTPRFCGDCCKAGTFLRDFCASRGFAISWLIVGIVRLYPCSRETLTVPQIHSGLSPHSPHVGTSTLRHMPNPAPAYKAISRQPFIAEWKALNATEDHD
jgi:hypothetical protein